MIDDCVVSAVVKACLFKEVLASNQLEGIGTHLKLEDLYLAELGLVKCDDGKIRKLKKPNPTMDELEEIKMQGDNNVNKKKN
jgi:hypothetical protein